MPSPFHVFISGGSGLIGSELIPLLRARGCRVTTLVRHPVSAGEDAVAWDPYRREIDTSALAGCDAIICLSGENIGRHWNGAFRQRIWDSRILTARFLAETAATLSPKPRVFICASGVNYGDGGDRPFAEDGPPGHGFFPDLIGAWEAATTPASNAGVRTINMRIGLVLTPRGGLLKQVLPLFRWGLGAALGPGTQYTGWLTLEDMVAAIFHVVQTEQASGPVNFVSPQPVTQREFAQTLGHVLHRPVLFTLPPWALRMATSKELAESAVLSHRMLPGKLTASGFSFQHPHLEDALRHLLP